MVRQMSPRTRGPPQSTPRVLGRPQRSKMANSGKVQITTQEAEERLHATAMALYRDMLRDNITALARAPMPPSNLKVEEVIRETVDSAISSAMVFEARFNARDMKNWHQDSMLVGLKKQAITDQN